MAGKKRVDGKRRTPKNEDGAEVEATGRPSSTSKRLGLGRWGILDEVAEPDRDQVLNLVSKNSRAYFLAAKSGNANAISEFIDKGISINLSEPTTGFTALHYAVSRNSRNLIELILAKNDVNHLHRDGLGRLPSELAGTFGEDLELARKLRELEIRQAEHEGVELTYRPRADLSQR